MRQIVLCQARNTKSVIGVAMIDHRGINIKLE
jgi:hypothetical protein